MRSQKFEIEIEFAGFTKRKAVKLLQISLFLCI